MSNLTNNTTALQELLDKANALPDAGGVSEELVPVSVSTGSYTVSVFYTGRGEGGKFFPPLWREADTNEPVLEVFPNTILVVKHEGLDLNDYLVDGDGSYYFGTGRDDTTRYFFIGEAKTSISMKLY